MQHAPCFQYAILHYLWDCVLPSIASPALESERAVDRVPVLFLLVAIIICMQRYHISQQILAAMSYD